MYGCWSGGGEEWQAVGQAGVEGQEGGGEQGETEQREGEEEESQGEGQRWTGGDGELGGGRGGAANVEMRRGGEHGHGVCCLVFCRCLLG